MCLHLKWGDSCQKKEIYIYSREKRRKAGGAERVACIAWVMSGESYMESDFYNDSAYTQDISTKMRVPDRLTAHGGVPGEVKKPWSQ